MSEANITVGGIFIGRLHKFKKKFYVKILNTKLRVPIRRKFGDSKKLKKWREEKANVVVKILSVEDLRGEIVATADNSTIGAIIVKHGVVEKFSDKVRKVAAKIEYKPSEAEIARRIDRRELKIVTIDGEDAKDLDDGVFAAKLDGGYFLGVYIADVSHYVRANSVLDAAAYERGTSIYPVDRVVPMLPIELSNGVCSLNPGVNRLAMACEMHLDSGGKVTGYEIFPTVIKVFRRLSYTQVNKFFSGETSELEDCAENLELLREIYELRKKIRTLRGAIEFEIPELQVKLSKDEMPIILQKKVRGVAERVIEECMLAANETVAEHTVKKLIPSLYRVHENPTAEKLENFNRLLNRFGLHIPTARGVQPAQFQKVMAQIQGTPAERVISTFALRTMQQARYSSKNLGHFGLAAEFYTHFTSPIRRYPDLIVHRMLKATPAELPKLALKLEEIALHSSECERRAVEIEREVLDWATAVYMKKFIGEEFDAVISGVTNFGIFVELDNGAEGLVHISTISDDYYNYVEAEFALVGRRTGKTYGIGEAVRVRLTRASRSKRQLEFELVEGVTAENLIVEVD